jgi:hypothetical protein
LRELRPADLATTVEELPPCPRSQIAAALTDEELADLLEEMPEQDQVRLPAGVGLERGADVVEEIQSDDAADLLAELPAKQRERLLTAMEFVQAEDLRRLQRYGPETAAGLAAHRDPGHAGGRGAGPHQDPDLPVTVASEIPDEIAGGLPERVSGASPGGLSRRAIGSGARHRRKGWERDS